MEVAKGIVRAQLWTGGFYWIETKGTIASREQAPILVGNHTCFMDPVYLFSNIAAPAVRIESKNVPLAGLVFRAVGALWIDRGAEKKKAKQEAEKKKANKGQQLSPGNGKAESGSSEPDKAGSSSSSEGEEQPSKPVTITEKIIARASDPRPGVTRLMIFPEGTCGNGLALQSFKYGAFLPMKPVQPVVMQYRYRYFDPSWVNDGPRGLPLTIRMLLSVFNTMTVQYLPVVDPKKELPESQQTPYAFGDLVQRKMAEAMGVPISHVSFLDVSMGMDCQDTCKRAKKALRQAKKGKGPSVQELERAARLSLDADPVLRKVYPVHLTNGEVKQVTDRIMGHRVDRTPLGRAVRLLMALDEDRAGYVGMDRFVSFFLEEDKVPALQPLPEGAGGGEEEEGDEDEDRVSEEQVRALCDACLAGGDGKGEGEGVVPELSTEGRRAALVALFRGFSAPASKGQWPEGLPRVGKEDGLPIFALPPFEVEPERLRRGAGVAGSGSEGAGAAGGAADGEAGQKEGGKKQAPAGPGGEELRYVSIRELVVLWAVLHAGLSSGADQSAGALEMQAKASSAAARGLRCCMEACGVLLQALPEEDRAVVLGGQGGALAGRYQVGGPLPTGPWGRAVSRRLRQLVLGARFDTMSLPRPQRKSKKDKKKE